MSTSSNRETSPEGDLTTPSDEVTVAEANEPRDETRDEMTMTGGGGNGVATTQDNEVERRLTLAESERAALRSEVAALRREMDLLQACLRAALPEVPATLN